MISPLPVLDETMASVGYWGSDIIAFQTAAWSRSANVKAMGLTNLADDYYNPSFIYPVCRQAIQILNPSAR